MVKDHPQKPMVYYDNMITWRPSFFPPVFLFIRGFLLSLSCVALAFVLPVVGVGCRNDATTTKEKDIEIEKREKSGIEEITEGAKPPDSSASIAEKETKTKKEHESGPDEGIEEAKKSGLTEKTGEKTALDYKTREVEIRCPKESDYHSAACAKALGDVDHADLIALNRGDADRPTVVYSYKGEKKIVWGVKERAISVNGKVVGVDLSDLDEQQAIALVRSHCKDIETVVWANADSLYVGAIEELTPCFVKKNGLLLNLEGFKGSEKNLENLKLLAPHLTFLSLRNAKTGDSELKHVSGLSNLKSLDLSGTKIGNAGLKHISGLSKLKKLDLEKTGVTNGGMRHLLRLSKLRRLYLGGTKVGLKGFKILSKLGDLQRLPVKNGEWTTSKVCSSRGIEWLVVDNGDLYYHEGGCKIMSVRRIKRRSHSIELCCVDDDAWAADPKYECHKKSAVITIHNDNSFSLKFSLSSDLDGKHIHCPKNAGS